MECERLSNHKENCCDYNGETVKSVRTGSKHTNLLNHIDNLPVSHNIRASSTMIKVTYNKGSKSPALQSFEGTRDSKINNGESMINLISSTPVLSEKDERGNNDFLKKSNGRSEVDRRRGQNGCKVVGSADEAKRQRKGLEVNREDESMPSPPVLIDPLRDRSKPVFDSRKHSQTGACVRGGEPGSDRNASDHSSIVPRDFKTRASGSEEKNSLDSAKTDESESESSCNYSESESEPKTEILDNKLSTSGKEVRKRKSDEREDKTPAKKMRRFIIDEEKEILFDDQDLPPGWQRFIHTRKGGSSDGQNDVHILSPNGKIFRFRGALKKYLEEEKLPYSIDDFYFGLYKRKSDVKNDSQNQVKRNSDAELLKRNKTAKNLKGKSKKSTKSDNSPTVEKSKCDYKVKREIIMNDSDLPPGWRRCIIIRSSGKYKNRRISFISPDGKKFKQKKRLRDYLVSINSPFSIDEFNFNNFEIGNGISKVINHKAEGIGDRKKENSISGNRQAVVILTKLEDDGEGAGPGPTRSEKEPCGSDGLADSDENSRPEKGEKFLENAKPRYRYSHPPMRVDPELPEGWYRSIKVRSTGESAGRMEVIINSPDGRKHRNKGALDQYLKQQKLPYKVDDFDFTLFGKSFKKPGGGGGGEAKPSPRFRPSIQFSPKESPKEKEASVTPESLAIGQVSGTMVACGITAVRNERRLRTSRLQHEKALKDYLESNNSTGPEEDSGDIPEKWIRDLARCRSEFGSLQENAASAIASATKEFLQELASQALKGSACPEKGLEYDDVANLVANSECLSSLKPLIPKKITFKEFVKLNRPTKFCSFT